MLKVLRDNLKYLSWILWVVIAIFILFVFVDFGATVPGGREERDAAVRVGDQRVTFGEFQARYQQTEDLYRQAYGDQFSPELAKQLRIPQQVLERLVAEKILLTEAERAGLAVTDGELQRRILDYAAFKDEEGRFVGPDVYARILRSSGYTPDSFERQMRQELLLDKLRGVMAQTLYVSASDVEQAFRDQTESASISFLRLPAEMFRDQVAVTPEQISAYYSAHSADFSLPEQRRIDYLLVDVNQLRSTLQPTTEELTEYYRLHQADYTHQEEVHVRHILLQVNDQRTAEQAEAGLERARQRIAGGEDFATVAREVSDDPGSKDKGGDLGFFSRGQMVKEFEDAAFAAQPGELVGPIRSPYGYHLIEVLERRPEGVRPFDEVEQAVRARYLSERSQSLAEARAKELGQRIRNEGLASEEGLQKLAAEGTGIVFASTPPLGSADPVPGVGRGTPFSTAAFQLAQGAVSDPVKIQRGWVVLYVKEILAPRVPSLEEVEGAVRAAVEREARLQMSRQRLEAARLEVAAGKSLDEVARELGVEVEQSGEFRRGAAVGALGVNAEVSQQAFSLDEGQVGGPVAYPQGMALFQVVERRRFDPVAFEAQKAQTRSTLENDRLSQLLGSIVEARRKEITVTYNPRLLESFDLQGGAEGQA